MLWVDPEEAPCGPFLTDTFSSPPRLLLFRRHDVQNFYFPALQQATE
jgi:hypothetical protein